LVTRAAWLLLAALACQGQPFLADYDAELREAAPRADGVRHVDTPALIEKLKALHVTAYFFLIWHAPTDWDDLRSEFLPASRAAGIDVWLYLVPPSECRPACSLPWGADYVRWGAEIASLARAFPHVKGFAIDDFNANLRTFTPAYLAQIRAAAPGVRFMPLVYAPAITKAFLDSYAPLIDGIIMAYRDGTYANTEVTATLAPQLDSLTDLMRPYGKPLVLMIYAAALSRAPVPPSAAYLRETIGTGLRYLKEAKIGGIVTYVLSKDGRTLAASANPARSGAGYASWWIPGGARTAAGDAGEFSTRVRFTPGAARLGLRFRRHVSFGTAEGRAGYHTLQILLDGQVVWEQDLAAGARDTWETVAATFDAPARAEGRLALRVFEKQGVSSLFAALRLDDLEPEGFSLADPGFEDPAAWSVSRTVPAFLVSIETFDPDRATHCFETVRELYGAARTEEQAVLAAVQRLFDAMAAGDREAAARVLTAEGRYATIRADGTTGGATHAAFLERLAASKEKMVERMWEPRVLIHGRVATVWTRYTFHRDGKFSHCGLDSFSLLKTSEGWKIAGFFYTVETAGCPQSPGV
jgi:hypothetical protein